MKKKIVPRSSLAKLLSCVFYPDVKCALRESEKWTLLDQCETCPFQEKFEREMAEEDERVMDEIDEIRRTGVWK